MKGNIINVVRSIVGNVVGNIESRLRTVLGRLSARQSLVIVTVAGIISAAIFISYIVRGIMGQGNISILPAMVTRSIEMNLPKETNGVTVIDSLDLILPENGNEAE